MGLKETLSAAFLTLAAGAAEPAGAAETQAVTMATRSALEAQAKRLEQTAQGAGVGSSGTTSHLGSLDEKTLDPLQAQAERLKQTAQGAGAGSSGVLPLEQK